MKDVGGVTGQVGDKPGAIAGLGQNSCRTQKLLHHLCNTEITPILGVAGDTTSLKCEQEVFGQRTALLFNSSQSAEAAVF